jgi:two-component system response regulator YesN
MLVEDEQIIREGFETFIDWNGLGYSVSASFPDGREALGYLENNTVDLIITDIEMTFVSGIALAKYVYEKGLHAKVIILTAYSSFDYISECMKYKAEDYILKTAPTSEIEEKLKKLHEQLETERIERERKTKLESWVTGVVPYLKEQFMKNLLFTGYKSEEELIHDVKRSGVDVYLYNAGAFLYKLEFSGESYNAWRYGYDGFVNAIHNFFDRFDKNRAFFYLTGSLKDFSSQAGRGESPIGAKTVYILELSNNGGNTGEMEKEFYVLFKINIKFHLIASFGNVFEITPKKANILNNETSVEKEGQQKYIITGVLEYINENIKDDINLEKAAASAYIAPEYLSRLFKKEIGVNFKEYTVQCKMNKAMEMLKDPKYKIYEIGGILGYKSVGFFSKVFREYADCSPMEYRNKYVVH